LEICHSTPVDEMHAFRLGVLLRALEFSMLHLLMALQDLKKNGKMVLDLLKKTIFECWCIKIRRTRVRDRSVGSVV
jgi:hypothetical protein